MANNQEEELFWRNPDEWLAIVILTENKDRTDGIIKNDLALLDRVPDPITGYHYKDVVKVKGPTGNKWHAGDAELNEYKAIEIHQRSKYLTFSFEAILSQSSDYFTLVGAFEKDNICVEFPWVNLDNNFEWRKGYCAAESFQIAQNILNKLFKKNTNWQLRNLKKM